MTPQITAAFSFPSGCTPVMISAYVTAVPRSGEAVHFCNYHPLWWTVSRITHEFDETWKQVVIVHLAAFNTWPEEKSV